MAADQDLRKPFGLVLDQAIAGSLPSEQIESWNEIFEEDTSGSGHAISRSHRWTPEHRRVVELSLANLFLSDGTIEDKMFDACAWDKELGAAISCFAARRSVLCLDPVMAERTMSHMVLNMCGRHLRADFEGAFLKEDRAALDDLVTLHLQSLDQVFYRGEGSPREDFAAVRFAADATSATWRTWREEMILPSVVTAAFMAVHSAATVLRREEGRSVEPLIAESIPSCIDAVSEGHARLRFERAGARRGRIDL